MLFCMRPTIDFLQTSIDRGFVALGDWFWANVLALCVISSNNTLFCYNYREDSNHIILSNHQVLPQQNFYFLGLILNQNLGHPNWNFWYKIKLMHFFNKNNLTVTNLEKQQLRHHSYFSYVILFWGYSPHSKRLTNYWQSSSQKS